MMAGLLSGVLAGATLAAPAIVAATPVTTALTTAEQALATQLAESIVTAVMKAQTDTRGLPEAEAKLRIQLAVQTVIRNSGVTPNVADAALDIATAKLKAQGFLDCLNPKDKEQTCTPAGAALASLSSLLKSIVDTTPASSNTPGGPIAIGAPIGLTPPNSGSSEYFAAVTPPSPPGVTPTDPTNPTNPTTPTDDNTPHTTGGTPPIGDTPSITPPTSGSSDYRGN